MVINFVLLPFYYEAESRIKRILLVVKVYNLILDLIVFSDSCFYYKTLPIGKWPWYSLFKTLMPGILNSFLKCLRTLV